MTCISPTCRRNVLRSEFVACGAGLLGAFTLLAISFILKVNFQPGPIVWSHSLKVLCATVGGIAGLTLIVGIACDILHRKLLKNEYFAAFPEKKEWMKGFKGNHEFLMKWELLEREYLTKYADDFDAPAAVAVRKRLQDDLSSYRGAIGNYNYQIGQRASQEQF